MDAQKEKTMKIALDYDETIDQCYPFFSALTAALKTAGWEIHIVTDICECHRQFRTQQLEDNCITYDVSAITGDKLGYCQKNGIEFAFDDYDDYYKGFPKAYLKLFTLPLLKS
jgi:hypothetical protein